MKIKVYVVPHSLITHKGKKVEQVGFDSEAEAEDFIYKRKLTKSLILVHSSLKLNDNTKYKIKQNSVGQIISIKKKGGKNK